MFENNFPHSFYIPVMGTGFTIDTSLFVAKYGITSLLSLVDDGLIEQVRKYWCEKYNEPYEKITTNEFDYRAKRITVYLNLLNKLVKKQSLQLKNSPFLPDSEITRYFEMLPNGETKHLYQSMLAETNSEIKLHLQDALRQRIVVGNIDVNIMTKLDGIRNGRGDYSNIPYGASYAASALRGYALSDLSSSVMFSAGFNPHLYSYATNFIDFFPDEEGNLKKKICLKVSDYRSAIVQGKYLAKHGLWVSEYSIESINCGGHAFVNNGQLLGPILSEFKQRRDELRDSLHKIYANALKAMKKHCPNTSYKTRFTVQGGIGTNEEHEFLMHNYDIDAIGWGSPFLLVPEVTNVDDEQLQKLLAAESDDIFLSSSSPLGVPFWNLCNSASEEARLVRISEGKPGSICSNGFAKFPQDFIDSPICKASREYQQYKLQELQNTNISDEHLAILKEEILNKSCICRDLAGGALVKKGIDVNATAAICPGPNIINFKKLMSLKEIIDHIYGRCSMLANNERTHMLLTEIKLQISYLRSELKRGSLGLPIRPHQKLAEVKTNLIEGITYYREIAKNAFKEKQDKFCRALQKFQEEIESIILNSATN